MAVSAQTQLTQPARRPHAPAHDFSMLEEHHGPGRIVLVANRKSGTNARDSQAIERARQAMGRERTRLMTWDPAQDPDGRDLHALIDRAEAEGARLIVAAGGDGTVMAVAQAMVGRKTPLCVLPLGTFNYFSRGLGLPEEPEEAASAILDAQPHEITVGSVNGQVFLNNASLGIYPAILKQREDIYARWGRYRMMAHWSVIKTFLKFQRPMHFRLTANGQSRDMRSPLVFVARSAYQLDLFGLKGKEAIAKDHFAVLIGKGETRRELFQLAWRLVTRTMQEGRDYELLETPRMRIEPISRNRHGTLIAFDGEKRREKGAFLFEMQREPLKILLPRGIPNA